MRRAGAFLQAARQAAIFIEEGDEVSECLGEEGAVVAGEKHVFSRAARTSRWRSAFQLVLVLGILSRAEF